MGRWFLLKIRIGWRQIYIYFDLIDPKINDATLTLNIIAGASMDHTAGASLH